MQNMDKGLTVPKWVLTNRPNIPKMPKIYLPKLSVQAQKLVISIKKASFGVRSPWCHATCHFGVIDCILSI